MAGMKPEVALFLGGATLIGGIAIGKIAVDAAQGRLPEPPPSGAPGPLDQAVRVVASFIGITVTLVQLPSAWDQAQKLLKEVAP